MQTTPDSTAPVNPSEKLSWAATLRVYLEPASLRMLALGFAAGLPLLLVLGTLSFRLREAGIDRTTIGYLSWVGLAYGFKWCWAPLVDRLPIPLLTRALGRRRSWLLLSQALIMVGLAGMALVDPKITLGPVVWFALLVAFGSATQDIALDAYRIESADVQRQAALAATYQTGYRLAMIWAGAGVLWIAARAEVANVAAYQHNAWQTAYLVMAACMLVGVLTVLFSQEPKAGKQANRDLDDANLAGRMTTGGVPLYGALVGVSLLLLIAISFLALATYLTLGLVYVHPLLPISISQSLLTGSSLAPWAVGILSYLLPISIYSIAIWCVALSGVRVRLPTASIPFAVWFTTAFLNPFAEFFARYRWQAALILALIAVYRISDLVMGIMANPFYVDMKYTKDEVAAVSKVYGVIMTLAGAFIGGVMAMRLGVMRVLMLGAVLSAASNLLFAWLVTRGHDVNALIAVISADNLSGGIASAAFIAYLSSLTNIQYSATQYALFSSMMVLAPKWIAGFSGTFVDSFGYQPFFVSTALLGLPVLVLVYLASRVTMVTQSANSNAPE